MRPFTADDVGGACLDVCRVCNDIQVVNLLHLVPWPYTKEEAHYFVHELCAKVFLCWAVIQKDTGGFAGCCNLSAVEEPIASYWLLVRTCTLGERLRN